MNREQKKELNRHRIIQAATELMMKNGIQGTSMKDVSDASKISIVTIYKYFANKESLAEAVTFNLFIHFSSELTAIANDNQLDFYAKIREFTKHSTTMRAAIPEPISQEFYDIIASSSMIGKYTEKWKEDFWQTMITAGREAEIIETTASDDAIKVFANLFVQYIDTPGRKLDTELFIQLQDLFTYGIVGRNGRNE